MIHIVWEIQFGSYCAHINYIIVAHDIFFHFPIIVMLSSLPLLRQQSRTPFPKIVGFCIIYDKSKEWSMDHWVNICSDNTFWYWNNAQYISFPSVVTERSSFSANSDLINIASSLFIKTSNTPSHPKTRNSSCSLSRSTIETSGIQDTGWSVCSKSVLNYHSRLFIATDGRNCSENDWPEDSWIDSYVGKEFILKISQSSWNS